MPRPNRKNEESNHASYPSSSIAEFLKPATITTALIGLIYFLGWLYVFSYYSRYGIQLDSLNLTPTSFVVQSSPWICFLLAIFIFAIAAEITANKETSENLKTLPTFEVPSMGLAFAGNIPIFLLGVVFYLIRGILFPSGPDGILIDFILYTAIFATIIISWKRISVIHIIFIDDTPFFQVNAIFFFILVSTLATTGWAQSQAITHVTRSPTTIELTWRDMPPQEIQSKNLVLITHQNGKYFVTPKLKPLPNNPQIYVIPDDQIRFALFKPDP